LKGLVLSVLIRVNPWLTAVISFFFLAWTAASLPAGAQTVQETLPCRATLDSGKPLAIADAVDLALCRNPQTREVWATARASAAEVGVAEAAWWPILSATGSIGRNRTDAEGYTSPSTNRSLGLSASLLLFDFGGRAATLENARQLLAAAEASRAGTVQSVIQATVKAYYDAQSALAALDAARLREKANIESVKAVEARYRAGTGTPADLLQARTALSQAVLARQTAEGAQRAAMGSLAFALAMPANTALALAGDTAGALPEGDLAAVDGLIEEARRLRPDLAAAEARLAAARADVATARSAGLPTLSLAATAAQASNGGGPQADTGFIGLTLNIPLFEGFARRERIRAAEARADAAAARRDRAALQVALDVWSAYQEAQTAAQTIRTSRDLEASAEQSARVAGGRYQAGVGTMLEWLTAQSIHAEARRQHIAARYNWLIARATLAQAVGRLSQEQLGP
jgi:TolC family type I secretion outer membrane protein